VYALGAILYECLTGRPPFRAETAAETERQVIAEEPAPPSRLNAKVPRDLETICLKCLQKAPRHRYATALALAEDLGRYERGEPIAARPVSRSERIARWTRRRPTAAALVLTAFALVGLAVVYGASEWRREARRRAEVAKWAPRLDLVKQLQTAGRFQDAREILQDLPDADVGELNDQIRAAQAELDLAQRLDRIRLNRVAIVDGRFDPNANRSRSDNEYEAALGEAGIGGFPDTPAAVAARVQESPIRTALVAALDDWAVSTDDEARRRWIMEVARTADPDPGGWRERVRDPALKREALKTLAEAAVVRDQSVQLLVALSQRMQAAGADPTAFLRRVQQQYPGDFWACFTLADVLFGKKPEECIRYYQAALAVRPETAVAHHNVGRALAMAYRVDEAIAHFREAIQFESRYAHAISNLGKALSMKGQNAEGLELVKRAVAIDETSARLHLNFADVLSRIGRDEEALDEHRRAIALEPNFVLGRVNFAGRLRELNRYEEAMEQLEYARGIDPNSGWLHLMIGQVLRSQKRTEEAIAEFETAVRLDPSFPEAHIQLAWHWRQKQSLQKALIEYDKALAQRPNDLSFNHARRGVLVQLGFGEEVRAAMSEAMKVQPSQHDAWSGYAELCLYLGHQDEYERACHELLGQFESSDDPLVCQNTSRICLLGVLGADDTARAAALIDRAARADPLRSPAAYHDSWFAFTPALARYRLGDFDGAIRALEALAAAKPVWSARFLLLSMAQRRAGRTDEAFRSFASAIRNYDSNGRSESNDDSWFYPTLRREMESVVMPNLAALLSGKEKPCNRDERLALIAACHSTGRTEMAASLLDAELAGPIRRPVEQGQRLVLIGICRSLQRTAAAARLFAEAFAVDPDLADRLDAGHRYNAACCAARAGCGDGEDAAGLSDRERAAWREQARVWFRDDLLAKRVLLIRAPTPERRWLPGKLESWFKDPDLARVRDAGELRKLPPPEQEAWRAIWRDAELLLAEARSTKSTNSRRTGLIQSGLGETARAEWESLLRAGSHPHDVWYGYAELCLYLGNHAEYERACHELLDRFEASRDPRVCEQVGRACLLGFVGPEDRTRAAALVERAVRAELSPADAWARPYFLIAQGLARYRSGDFDGAVRAIHGEALRVHGPLPHLVVAMAHQRAGRTDEALRSLAKGLSGYDWSQVDHHDAWLYHTLRREAEPLVMPNLATLLTGQASPRDQPERLALIAVCRSRQRTATAARLYAEAFAADPELANRLDEGHRYRAACCAARAGCGDGEDATGLSDQERAAWRDQARVWLRDDLVAKRTILSGAPAAEREALRGKLATWLSDLALAGVRDSGLRKLPTPEQEAWRALWRDAEALLAEAGSANSKALR
jgi:tetratricopeptide (TPR) repeat protein